MTETIRRVLSVTFPHDVIRACEHPLFPGINGMYLFSCGRYTSFSIIWKTARARLKTLSAFATACMWSREEGSHFFLLLSRAAKISAE